MLIGLIAVETDNRTLDTLPCISFGIDFCQMVWDATLPMVNIIPNKADAAIISGIWPAGADAMIRKVT